MVKNLENNVFIRETLNGLIKNNVDIARLGTRGFEIDNSKSEKDCILVMGLNLAGDEKTAKMRKIKEHFCIVSVICISREVHMYIIHIIDQSIT